MSQRTVKMDPDIRALLVKSGRPWFVDTGGHHFQLRVGGRLVAVIPNDYRKGSKSTRRNALASVRRYLRQTAEQSL